MDAENIKRRAERGDTINVDSYRAGDRYAVFGLSDERLIGESGQVEPNGYKPLKRFEVVDKEIRDLDTNETVFDKAGYTGGALKMAA
ncbi:MAG: hypothetical protein ISS36_00855 [Candidatus Aenigmarchaeota archaeon]|nr:hypothetical protein [Candidatus Aenigmarchaeota archaeon]